MAQKRGRRTFLSVKAQRWVGLFTVALGVFLLAAVLTFHPGAYRDAAGRGEVLFPFSDALVAYATGDPPVAPSPLAALYHNAGGGLGVLVTTALLRFLGWIGVWIVPILFLSWGYNRLLVHGSRSLLWASLMSLPLTAALVGVASSVGLSRSWSGALGDGIARGVQAGIGPVGGALVLGVAVVGFLFLEAEVLDGRRGTATRVAAVWIAGLVRGGARLFWGGLRLLVGGVVGLVSWIRRRPWESGVSIGRREDAPEHTGRRPAHAAPEETEAWAPRIVDHEAEERLAEARGAAPLPGPKAPVPAGGSGPDRRSETPSLPAARPPERAAGAAFATGRGETVPASGSGAQGRPPGIPEAPPARPGERPAAHQDIEDAVREARRQARPGKTSSSIWSAARGEMAVPSLDILDEVPDAGPPVPEDELRENSKILTQTLEDFGVSGRVGEVHPGPVITRYEYIPGPGIKVSQILNRQDDLALKLRASRIRILAPIPGKAAVGIEIPNRSPAPIFLRRILETRAFKMASGPLPLALGKDIGGAPVTTELSRMPHLLLAGTTGSGKSVCMNALITSLLMKRSPAELRMIMIDPKMLELPMYNGIPHLLTEVVTDPKVATRSLKWALLEMQTRYKLLAARGCRNLASYNAKLEREGPLQEGEEKLPYIVIFIDELADLMLASGKEVEEPIARIAQLARAVGLHLIIATQRPSVDVITGVIKANFPARIAFQVASRTDSRTILDQNGAESLLGKGDMLFLPPGQAAPHRVHGAFVSEEETQRLARAWREQGEPVACPGLEEVLAEPELGGGGVSDDPLFEDAARLVVAVGQASASLLQRRLKVGYARAARLVDMLEMAGVVAPQDGSKAREILVDEARLEHVLAGMDA